MNILALDPGSSFTGYALVEGGASARVRFREGGRVASQAGPFLDLLRDVGTVACVAVERPSGYIYDPVRGAHVVATSNVAGGMAWAAQALGYWVVEVPATSVRKTLLGKSTLGFGRSQKEGDMDRAIKAALPNFVDALPAKSNSHVRDALALSVAANFIVLNKRRSR